MAAFVKWARNQSHFSPSEFLNEALCE